MGIMRGGTCPASLRSAFSCLLLISEVPGQLPPPPPPSPSPPRPEESCVRETGSASEISVQSLKICSFPVLVFLFVLLNQGIASIHCPACKFLLKLTDFNH